jgi:hypothetical protein
MANFAAASQAGLVRIIKRKLKKIQYRPHLIDGCSRWYNAIYRRGGTRRAVSLRYSALMDG